MSTERFGLLQNDMVLGVGVFGPVANHMQTLSLPSTSEPALSLSMQIPISRLGKCLLIKIGLEKFIITTITVIIDDGQ